MRIRVALAFISLVSMLALAAPAYAAFPGNNGKIALDGINTINPDGSGKTFVTTGDGPVWSPDGKKIVFWYLNSGENDIGVVNADGTGLTNLTPSSGFENRFPAWSPDGSKIVFSREPLTGPVFDVYVMNADGTGLAKLTNAANRSEEPLFPAWSPDGGKIAFSRPGRGCISSKCPQVYTINPDGSGLTNLSNDDTMFDSVPKWSPDGTKIVFTRNPSDRGTYDPGVEVMNRDGTNAHFVRCCGFSAAWSPDGTRIVMNNEFAGIETMNPDGTNATLIDTSESSAASVDWQPIPPTPGPGYARPKGATPFQTYFTVAYKPCTSPNEQHGAPLAVLSCSPPQQASDFLTVGTLDANGQPAKSVGSMRLDVKPGNPSTPQNEADVKVAFSEKDIRNKSDLTPYAGELDAQMTWQETDKWSGPIGQSGSQPATSQQLFIPLSSSGVQCTPNPADPSAGSICQSTTTLNAIVPGMVQEDKWMNVEIPKVQVFDGGADLEANTRDDNTLFLTEGIFVP